MRFLILVLNIMLGSTLLSQPAEVLAASEETSANKNTHLRGHAKRLRGKGKELRLHRVKQKKSPNPGDVWERIRSGMQIPRPKPIQTLPGQTFAQKSNGLPKIGPGQTRLHMRSGNHLQVHKLNALILSEIGSGDKSVNSVRTLPKLTLTQKNHTLSGYTRVPMRIHTHIDRYPHLHKLGSIISAETVIGHSLPPSKPIRTDNLAKPLITPVSAKFAGQNMASNLKIVEKQSGIGEHRGSSQTVMYERVNKHIVWYTQHRDYLHQVAERARPYLYHIVDALSKHKLPSELALLPIVESAYQPTAQSPKSAAGLWQFIPGTGHDFDLEQNTQYDARLDIAASTQAAMRYLSFLKQHFNGDWLLALAAYNCGLGAVDAAINRNNIEGLNTDYWSLRLPEETQEYVPRFLALSSIFANPATHGLKLSPVRNEPYFIKVKIDRKNDIKYLAEKDLSAIAQLANLSYEQFSRLNPGYLNSKLATNGPFTLLMPIANANQLHQRLASIAQFVDEPAVTITHTPLKSGVLTTAVAEKTALSLLTDITLPTVADFVTVSDPFLSLNLNAGQTTPRIVKDVLQPPLALAPDSKKLKKSI
jgi:soluble lytic murein transglycosylase-like protein